MYMSFCKDKKSYKINTVIQNHIKLNHQVNICQYLQFQINDYLYFISYWLLALLSISILIQTYLKYFKNNQHLIKLSKNPLFSKLSLK